MELEQEPRFGTLRRRACVTLAMCLACYLGGAASLYMAGPRIWYVLRETGGHLIGMGGDAPLDSADEIRAVVETLARQAVTEEAVKVVGPARVVRK